MDDRRIEHALRQGPPDESQYVPRVGRALADGQDGAAERANGDFGPAAFESHVGRPGVRIRPAGTGRGSGRWAAWSVPLAAVLTIVVAGLALRIGFEPGASPTANPRDLLARIRADGVLRIAVSNEAPQTAGTGGAYIGFDIDVARAVAEELGVQADIPMLSPDEILAGTGNWELAFPSSTLPDPLVGATLGPAYYAWPDWLVVESEAAVTTIDELAGSTICVVEGSQGAAWLAADGSALSDFPLSPPADATAIERASDEACTVALAEGEAQAAVTDSTLDIDLAGRGLRLVGSGPAIVEHRVVLVRQSAELGDPTSQRAAVQAAVDDLRAAGELAELSRRAFGGTDLTGDTP